MMLLGLGLRRRIEKVRGRQEGLSSGCLVFPWMLDAGKMAQGNPIWSDHEHEFEMEMRINISRKC